MKLLLYLIIVHISIVIAAQPSLIIEGIDSAVTNNGYVIPRTSPTLLTFRNSRLIADGSEMYILRSGDDSWGEGHHNNLDNAIITGNYLFSSSPGQVHGIMAGYNINYDVRYNYIEGSNYVVFEGGNNDGTNMINITGGFSYNIFKNNRFYTFGYDGVFIYNNTFYSNTLGRVGLDNYLIRVSSNSQLDITVPSKNVKIKNNIFYSVYDNYAIVFMNNEDTIGFRCDYNVYYWDGEVDHTPKFFLNGTKTWAQWQALGYDKHSIIINPNFLDIINFTPSKPLDFGTNLGTEYDYGLNRMSGWNLPGNCPDTVQQVETWQVGAVLINDIKTSDIIKNAGNLNSLKIYPNPVDGVLTASILTSQIIEKINVKINTLKGVTVYSGILLKDEIIKQFDVSYLDSGVYLLSISSDQINISKQFIKK